MQKLNFPYYSFRFKNSENKTQIFDELRKKFVALKPEEWVRQHCLKYIIYNKKYPKTLINVEKKIIVNGLNKRYDIVILNPGGSPPPGANECLIKRILFPSCAKFHA